MAPGSGRAGNTAGLRSAESPAGKPRQSAACRPRSAAPGPAGPRSPGRRGARPAPPPVDSFEVTLGNSSSAGAPGERAPTGRPEGPFPGPDPRPPREITWRRNSGLGGREEAMVGHGEQRGKHKKIKGKRKMKNECKGAVAPGGGFRYSPKEVVFAVKLPFSRKAFLCQIAFTFTALNTLHMPSPVQYIQQKPVQDWPFAACTVNHCLWLFLRAGGIGFPDVKQKKKN